MAPSTLFSHFRTHRRAGSTPSSPQPLQSSQFTTLTPAASPSPVFDSPPAVSPASNTQSPLSSAPPILPPIQRVTSQKEHRQGTADSANVSKRPSDASQHDAVLSLPTNPVPVLPPIPRVPSQREKHPVEDQSSPSDEILDEKRNVVEPNINHHPERLSRISSKTRASFADFGRAHTSPSLGQLEQGKPPKTPSISGRSQNYDPPFLHPQAQHASSPSSSSVSSFHKAASSTNLAIESSPASSRSAQGSNEKTPAARHSKGKLNLLNPVSLLKRRRTSQVVESHPDAPMIPTKSMDVPVMRLPADYDPRIKGKGIHNFDDGPRPKRNWSANDMPGMVLQSGQDMMGTRRRSSIPLPAERITEDDGTFSQEREHAPVFVENFEDEDSHKAEGIPAVQRESLANSNFLARMSKHLDFDALDFTTPVPPAKSHDPVGTSPAPSHVPATPPAQNARSSRNTDNSSFRISSDQSTARSSESNDTKATSPPQSPRVTTAPAPSRNLDPAFQPTHELTHLPSTASHNSRFSFQLNSDYCIEQEKALEEKHKQKQAATHSKHVSLADSRFDELGEEDIDYDDMVDDDGYEEDIPTMNADEEITTAGLGDRRLSSFRNVPPEAIERTFSAKSARTASQSQAETTRNPPAHASVKLAATSNLTQRPTDMFTSQGGNTMAQVSDFGDMYFDDGIIDSGIIDAVTTGGDSNAFDESLLDSPIQGRFNEQSSTEDFPTPKRHPHGTAQNETQRDSPTSQVVSTSVYHNDPFGITEEKTPTKIANNRQEQPSNQPTSSLNAYHNALAEAASKAARDGKFQRQNSVMTASSVYSSNPSLTEQAPTDPLEEDDMPGSRQPLEDTDEEDDPMVAAANAEALASDEDYLYAQEFGFFRNPNTTGDGQLHSGGYFGQPNFLGTSPRNREPNLTPITERSEYSTRNSIVGTTPWGPPSSGPWGPPSSASLTNTQGPGLKDLAASMGVDDDDMTLGQLLRLRKETFGTGSGPQSAHPSSSSNESSPISQNNPSPLASRTFGGSVTSIENQRRLSELELPQVDEVPEAVESGEDSGAQDSPISDNVTLGTARAILTTTRTQQRRASAEILAQEYSSLLNSSPVPIIAEPIKPTPPASPTQPSTSFDSPATVAGRSSPPILTSPKPQRASMSSAIKAPIPKASSPLSSPPIGDDQSNQSGSFPAPPPALFQKLANRPAPDAYRQSWETSQTHHRRRSSADSDGLGASSVAYVREVDEDGIEKWFLEKRKMKSSGELVILGREPVESG